MSDLLPSINCRNKTRVRVSKGEKERVSEVERG